MAENKSLPPATVATSKGIDLSSLSPKLRAKIEKEISATDPAACRDRIISALVALVAAMKSAPSAPAALALAGSLPGLYTESLTARRASGETLTRGRKLGS